MAASLNSLMVQSLFSEALEINGNFIFFGIEVQCSGCSIKLKIKYKKNINAEF